MQVLLNIPSQDQWTALAPLLQHLGISFQMRNEQPEQNQVQDDDWEIILGGVNRQNFQEFYQQWELDRHDSPLAFREP